MFKNFKKKSPQAKAGIISFILVMALLISYVAYSNLKPADPVEYELIKTTYGTITDTLNVSGTVESGVTENMLALEGVMVEEVFVNVAHYAYGDGEGDADLRIGFEEDTRTFTFCIADKGIPFDPLQKPDPDITLSAEDRQIGGLGIFIAKKTMDTITYAYENGENVLTMTKKL